MAFFFSGVTIVLFCFVFRHAFVEAAAFRSIVLRYYAGVPIATRRVFFLFFFVAFSEYFFWCHFRFLFVVYGEYVVRSFLPDGMFSIL